MALKMEKRQTMPTWKNIFEARGYRVQLFENEEAFLKMLKRSERKEETAEERSLQEKVVHDLTIIAV